MFTDQVADYNLNAPCRCLDAVRGDTVSSRFILASDDKEDSTPQLHVLRFHSEMNEFGMDGVLKLPPTWSQISHISTSSLDASKVMIVGNTIDKKDVATVYRIPATVMERTDELEYKPQEDDLMMEPSDSNISSEEFHSLNESHQVATFPSDTRLAHAIWYQDEAEHRAVTLDYGGNVVCWDVEREQSVRRETVSTTSGNTMTPPRLASDVHNYGLVGVACGTTVKFIDWRMESSIETGIVLQINKAHKNFGVTDVDYNPNKPNVLVTAGQDALIKFWDLRMAKTPVMVGRGGHSHWISSVRYNPFHDQLVVSASTDATVNLWRMSSISSAPLVFLEKEEESPNLRVQKVEHTAEVYSVAWGAADAWIYASVAYDGKVVLHHVPSNEKYKILL